MKFERLAATMTAIIALSGCAVSSPESPRAPGPKESLVQLDTRTGDDVLARRLDGQQVQSLTHFILPTGRHSLEVGLVMASYQDTHRRCIGTLAYDNFQPGGHYTLVTDRSGGKVKLVLINQAGTTITESDELSCI